MRGIAFFFLESVPKNVSVPNSVSRAQESVPNFSRTCVFGEVFRERLLPSSHHLNRYLIWAQTGIRRNARQNGENVTSFWGIAFVACDMGWLWTGWIGPAPVQMSGYCLCTALSWFCYGLLQGLVVFHWPFVSSWTVTLIILGLEFLRARLLRLCCTAAFPPIFVQLRKGPLW